MVLGNFFAGWCKEHMKYMQKVWVRVVVAAVIGFLLAGLSTHITYPCAASDVPNGESVAQCVAFEKATMHPSDLLINKQDSLVHFAQVFVITGLIVFVILSMYIRKSSKRQI